MGIMDRGINVLRFDGKFLTSDKNAYLAIHSDAVPNNRLISL